MTTEKPHTGPTMTTVAIFMLHSELPTNATRTPYHKKGLATGAVINSTIEWKKGWVREGRKETKVARTIMAPAEGVGMSCHTGWKRAWVTRDKSYQPPRRLRGTHQLWLRRARIGWHPVTANPKGSQPGLRTKTNLLQPFSQCDATAFWPATTLLARAWAPTRLAHAATLPAARSCTSNTLPVTEHEIYHG